MAVFVPIEPDARLRVRAADDECAAGSIRHRLRLSFHQPASIQNRQHGRALYRLLLLRWRRAGLSSFLWRAAGAGTDADPVGRGREAAGR